MRFKYFLNSKEIKKRDLSALISKAGTNEMLRITREKYFISGEKVQRFSIGNYGYLKIIIV